MRQVAGYYIPSGECPPPIIRERRDTSGVKPVAVFLFLPEDWPPWIALVRMRKHWPELRFEMKAGYL